MSLFASLGGWFLFTFSYPDVSSLDITIDIYSLDGQKIKQIKENNVEGDGTFFYKIPYNGWDGRNSNGEKIANGTYVYYLKVSSNNSIIHEGLYKLTKLE